MVLDPLLPTVSALCLAALFGSAALSKATDGATFRAILADYQLLPSVLLGTAARSIPLLESMLALAWLMPPARPVAAAASAGLLTIYAGAMAVNLRRGRTHISCGCSVGSADRLSGWLVARNLALAMTALLTGLPDTGRPLGAADYAVALAAAAVLSILYLAANQLIANSASVALRQRGRSW